MGNIFEHKNLSYKVFYGIFIYLYFQIEKVIDSAIDEAKEIFESEDESSTEEIPNATDFDYLSNDNIIVDEEITTETSEPSSDIDLGSVQEV